MLQQQEFISQLYFESFITREEPGKTSSLASKRRAEGCGPSPHGILSTEENPSTESTEESTEESADHELEDAARTERDYLRQRLREELQREPTEQELDEWLRQHTEGY
jgi:hypothetical protein